MGKLISSEKHLILGGKGFIGSHLHRFLDRKNHKVTRLYGVDLRNYDTMYGATYGYDYVWALNANMGGVGYFSKEQYYPPLDNFQMDINLLRACEKNKVKRVFYPASACAYNTYFEGTPLEESMLNWSANPDQMYGWEKLTMLKLMRHSPLDVRVGVLHTIYGEGQEYKGRKAKFPPQIAHKMILAQTTGEVEVWGDGTQTRTFLHIDDAIQKMYEIMMSDFYYGEVNIGSDEEVSVNDVISICSDILQIKPQIHYDTTKPTGPSRRLCSNEKFNTYYKTRQTVSLRDGFQRLINYIKRYEQISSHT